MSNEGETQSPTLKRLGNVHHAAYRCRDAEQTRWFYEDVLGLPLAAAMGFDPQASGVSDDTFGIRFVATILPTLLAFPAIFLLLNYPIDEARHKAIQSELTARGIGPGGKPLGPS